jgi:hypothetical protein
MAMYVLQFLVDGVIDVVDAVSESVDALKEEASRLASGSPLVWQSRWPGHQWEAVLPKGADDTEHMVYRIVEINVV